MRIVGLVTTVLAGVIAVGGAGAAFSHESVSPGVLQASVKGVAPSPEGSLPHAFLDLDTWPDSMAGPHGQDGGAHPDWVTYGPSTNLSVPAHSVVTVTIHQYDSGEEVPDHYFAQVHGTVDGTETVDGKVVKGIDPLHVGHTFTLHGSVTDQDPLFVSVPLPAVPDDAANLANGYPKPHVVTFSFVTKGPGRYVFQCEFPCGENYANFGGAMSTQTYMEGTVTVTASA